MKGWSTVATTQKGASLDPNTHAGGGQVPNGDYTIKKARAGIFTYPGTDAQVPAAIVEFNDGSQTYEQMYKAGDLDHLVPSDDGKRFVHPGGEAASIYKGGAFSLFLGSLGRCGFAFTGDEIPQIEGIKVTLESFPAPKGKSSENKDRMIPLVTKLLAVKGKNAANPTTKPATVASTAKSTATPAVSSNGTGDIDTVAIEAVMAVLGDGPTKVKGLAVRCLKHSPGYKLNDLTKLITPEWLEANAEATGWTIDGENLVLA
jgi:hypothetical protein